MAGLCYLVSFVCQVALTGSTQNRKLKAVEPSAGRHWSLLSRSTGPALLHQPSGNPAIPAQPSPVARGVAPNSQRRWHPCSSQEHGRTDKEEGQRAPTSHSQHFTTWPLQDTREARVQTGGLFSRCLCVQAKILLLCKKERTEIGGN